LTSKNFKIHDDDDDEGDIEDKPALNRTVAFSPEE
jgi:hypothetical protein